MHSSSNFCPVALLVPFDGLGRLDCVWVDRLACWIALIVRDRDGQPVSPKPRRMSKSDFRAVFSMLHIDPAIVDWFELATLRRMSFRDLQRLRDPVPALKLV